MFKFSDAKPCEVRKQDDDCNSQRCFDVVYIYHHCFAKTRKCKPSSASPHLLDEGGGLNLMKRSITVT